MKKIKFILLSLLVCVTLVSCNTDGMNDYRKKGQYIELSFDEYNEKIAAKDDFVFIVTKNDCSACKNYYSVISQVLDSNSELVIYYMIYDKLEGFNTITMTSYLSNALGKEYYEELGFDNTLLYTPTTAKIVDGVYEDADINVLEMNRLLEYFEFNYTSLDYYYDYARRTAANDSFKLFVSLEEDNEYDELLRNYFLNNKDKDGLFLALDKVSDDDKTKLLNRINYFLDSDQISSLASYFYLEYNEGKLIDYQVTKFDNDSLNKLYE